MANANKQPVFSMMVVINDDGTYNDKILLEPGGEIFAATFLFNMINGTVTSTVLDYIKKKYPKQYNKINNLVSSLCNEFVNQNTSEDDADAPCIKPSEVFGGKNDQSGV